MPQQYVTKDTFASTSLDLPIPADNPKVPPYYPMMRKYTTILGH